MFYIIDYEVYETRYSGKGVVCVCVCVCDSYGKYKYVIVVVENLEPFPS